MTKKICIGMLPGTLLIISAIFSTLNAQTIQATVSVQAERVQPEYQDILTELSRKIEDYINNFEWTGENESILIESGLTFIIETVTDRGAEKIFSGQFAINSPSKENYVDKSIQFPYQPDQFFTHQSGLFDPLLGLVDYYIYMVIGGELDTYFLKGGTIYYEKAKNIANEGLVSSYSRGWRDRLDQVNLITGGDHAPLREAKFYYYEGLFFIEKRQNAQKAPQYSTKVVDLLEKVHERRPNSSALKRFLDYHHQEMCKLFTYDETRENLFKMMRIDNRHRETYEDCETAAPATQ